MQQLLEPSRARRLKALTHEVHEQLDGSIMSAHAFDTLEGYGRFVAMQHRFHTDIAPLYSEDRLRNALPGLAARQKLALIGSDLGDLGIAIPADGEVQPFTDPIDVPTALGWLYVAEGSNMGAALLRKQAAKLGLSDDHGARHLAPTGEGPAAHWRAFTAALDAVELDDDAEVRVIAGAKAAFARVQQHANLAFA